MDKFKVFLCKIDEGLNDTTCSTQKTPFLGQKYGKNGSKRTKIDAMRSTKKEKRKGSYRTPPELRAESGDSVPVRPGVDPDTTTPATMSDHASHPQSLGGQLPPPPFV